MSGAKVLNSIGFALLVIAVLADYLSPRFVVPRPEALAVRNFPRVIGAWRAGSDRQVDPEIADRLTTATIVERDYRDSAGRDIDLLLVTADRDQDIHDPSLCFPAQGWQMGKISVLRYGSQRVNSVDVQQDGQSYSVLYWLAGYHPAVLPSNRLLATIVKMRGRVVGYHEGASLLVRLVAKVEDKDRLDQFAGQVIPQIDALRRASDQKPVPAKIGVS